MTYRFAVAQGTAPFADDYRVFVHFLDEGGQVMFTDDHDPPEPTTSWRAGQEIAYERRKIVPVYPYIGEVTVAVGLYSPTQGDRLPLAGEHLGDRSYRAASFEMAPQSESGFLMYEDGWHLAESAPAEPDREWQWTTGRATIMFRNPRAASTIYLEVDGRPELFETPQVLTLTVDGNVLDTLDLSSPDPTYHVIPVPAASLGEEETSVLTLTVEPSFVPSVVTNGENADDRELGVQVFYAFLDPVGPPN
jgi:hypothetical protein